MSQQEFENYLALLTRLLRISPRERDRVAGEFRSHMEDRLDDLLGRGVPRDEAPARPKTATRRGWPRIRSEQEQGTGGS
jgi:hypothetical protein